MKIVSAIGGDVIEIDVPPQATVAAVKREIASKKKIPSSTVLLVHRGKQLDDNDVLQDANVGDYDKLYLITRTEGGR
ncbi:MAG: ubiquitin-like domain-containing protein [Candidatus Atabeyarchaeum deiterrae]